MPGIKPRQRARGEPEGPPLPLLRELADGLVAIASLVADLESGLDQLPTGQMVFAPPGRTRTHDPLRSKSGGNAVLSWAFAAHGKHCQTVIRYGLCGRRGDAWVCLRRRRGSGAAPLG